MLARKFTKQDILRTIETLKSFSIDDDERGVTRLAYSDQDEAAHSYIIGIMKENGLELRRDAIGSIFARLPGKRRDLPAIATGSHLDSVPNGGRYDGVLGVVAGLYALLQFQPEELERDVEVIVFRAEESSRFGMSCIGSKILGSDTNYVDWDKNLDDAGLSLFEAINNAGYDSSSLSGCRLASDYLDGFVELHIEQGKTLEAAGKSVGVVYGIAAPTRFEIVVKGHADHSGATPMGQRSDALVAAAQMVKDINFAACKESARGTVGTVGKLNTFPNSMNVIPGECRFFVDIRGVDKESINRVADALFSSMEKAAFDNQVEISQREISREDPVLLDENVCRTIEQSCEQLQLDYMRLPSGAGHDAMYMAKNFPTAMIFVPSEDGVSHHPDEYTADKHIFASADLLATTIKNLANQV